MRGTLLATELNDEDVGTVFFLVVGDLWNSYVMVACGVAVSYNRSGPFIWFYALCPGSF